MVELRLERIDARRGTYTTNRRAGCLAPGTLGSPAPDTADCPDNSPLDMFRTWSDRLALVAYEVRD
jgi:hypothetical protein